MSSVSWSADCLAVALDIGDCAFDLVMGFADSRLLHMPSLYTRSTSQAIWCSWPDRSRLVLK